jgi:hypothetical protein
MAIPDLKKYVMKYMVDYDADSLIQSIGLGRKNPKNILGRLKYLIADDRSHKWMYDGASMARLLSSQGFLNPTIMAPGSTMIPNPGKLDLYERIEDSMYIEAFNP